MAGQRRLRRRAIERAPGKVVRDKVVVFTRWQRWVLYTLIFAVALAVGMLVPTLLAQ